MKSKGELIFKIVIAAILIIMLISLTGNNPKTRLFPLIIVCSTLIVCAVLIINDLKSHIKDKTCNNIESHKNNTVFWKILRIYLWLLGFLVALYFFKYYIVAPLFILLIMKIENKRTWFSSATTAAITGVSIFMLFDILLKTNL